MEFNEKLQRLRAETGMTQEQMAEKLFVSRVTVSKWESGRGYPNIESLKLMAGAVNTAVLFTLLPKTAPITLLRHIIRRVTMKKNLPTMVGWICLKVWGMLFTTTPKVL